MKTLFTKHLRAKNTSWLSHASVALRVGVRYFIASACFILHGLFPFIPIPGSYNFECMIQYLENMNDRVSK